MRVVLVHILRLYNSRTRQVRHSFFAYIRGVCVLHPCTHKRTIACALNFIRNTQQLHDVYYKCTRRVYTLYIAILT